MGQKHSGGLSSAVVEEEYRKEMGDLEKRLDAGHTKKFVARLAKRANAMAVDKKEAEAKLLGCNAKEALSLLGELWEASQLSASLLVDHHQGGEPEEDVGVVVKKPKPKTVITKTLSSY